MKKSLIPHLLGSLMILLASGQARAEEANIEQLIDQKLQEYFSSEAFDKQVEASIVRFIEKQNQARAEQARQQRQAQVANLPPVDPASDYVRGAPDAVFTLVEYSDYECPYCKRFHVTAKTFVENNPDVNWVYRHFPLNFHNPGAQKEAEAAECAGALGGSEAFWRYSDLIFERTRSNGKGFPIANLGPLAEELGLDRQAFDSCMSEERFRDKVLAQTEDGKASGVTGTPGNFLLHNASGEAVAISGAQPLASLEAVLQQMKDALK
ncbi:DsbA family protein [Marinobacterium mangrovicola]|uniref:Protein-disulfide isomerase n=1 Tax=Marinobacterium mangrovicola TaxID=1476959 RepID=A0A4R1G6J1_9GAMM|nr:thioredoxin domain-containing protein [Marinobacterium mangrovicola]TCK02351.1 protein-disulfide isomerase [Marinobacterium mangrovicola]